MLCLLSVLLQRYHAAINSAYLPSSMDFVIMLYSIRIAYSNRNITEFETQSGKARTLLNPAVSYKHVAVALPLQTDEFMQMYDYTSVFTDTL